MSVENARQEEWHFLGLAREFPLGKPRARSLVKTPVVVLRGANGLRCFVDRCPHRGYPLSKAKCSKASPFPLVCAYHGWSFDEQGTLLRRPGHAEEKPPPYQLPSFAVREVGPFVFASARAESSLPHWMNDLAPTSQPPMNTFWVNRKRVGAARLHVIENLLDPFHTHFVHAPLLRADSQRVSVKVQASYRAGTLSIDYRDEPTPAGWVSRVFEGKRVRTVGSYHETGAAVLEYWGSEGLDLRVTMLTSDLEAGTSSGIIIFQLADRGLPFFIKRPLLLLFANTLVRQDQKALETQQKNLEKFSQAPFWQGQDDTLLALLQKMISGQRVEEFERSYTLSI